MVQLWPKNHPEWYLSHPIEERTDNWLYILLELSLYQMLLSLDKFLKHAAVRYIVEAAKLQARQRLSRSQPTQDMREGS